jgi:hypothetical protein
MKKKLTVLAICLTLLVPCIADAKKPRPPVDAACALLLSPTDDVYTGESFRVKLVRVPSYPGAFRNPTIKIDVFYPSIDNSIPPAKATFTLPLFNVTYVEASFPVPLMSDGIVIGDVVEIFATVTEPIKGKKKYKTTSCTTTAVVQQGANDPPQP